VRHDGSGDPRRPPVDRVFGSNSQLRALTEVCASDDAREKFINDLVAPWVKVVELDPLRPAQLRRPDGCRCGRPKSSRGVQSDPLAHPRKSPDYGASVNRAESGWAD
jgi:hypothetical protein